MLVRRFGKAGHYYYHVCRGIDEREVKPNRIRKSVGAENTFRDNKNKIEDLKAELDNIIDRLMLRLEKVKRPGFTLTLKLKSSDFQIMSRSLTVARPLTDPDFIKNTAHYLLENINHQNRYYRLIGLQISNFSDDVEVEEQRSLLFEN